MKYEIAKIFEERPYQWGLWGDPYLWDDFEQYFSNISIPYTREDFSKEFFYVFEILTGEKINTKVYSKSQYNKSVISKGMICREFWRREALPLLLKRLQKLNQQNTNE